MTRHTNISNVNHWRAPMAIILVAAVLSACGSGSPTAPDAGSAFEAPVEAPSGSPAEAPTETPVEAPSEAPAETPNETSDDTNEQGEDAGPDDTPNEVVSEGPIACGPIDLLARLRILELVNESRAAGQFCADEWFPAADALSWDDRLEQAAVRHSNDMAAHDVFSHTGTDGSSISDRATDSGYAWNRIGENIAAGQNSVEQAIQGWLDSPGHCRNIMQPAFKNMSVACDANSSTVYRNYWTQVLGTER